MRTIFGLCAIFLMASCSMVPATHHKINGVSFVSSREPIDTMHVNPVLKLHANYASIMPYGFVRNTAHPEVIYNRNRQLFGETQSGVKQYIETLQQHAIKIMLKPQLWVGGGVFTGLINMKDEAAWDALEASYTAFILDFAKLAEEVHADMFCIGTELEGFIDHRPAYWKGLIAKIRKVYHGKLTYAANWNEYNRTPFWEDLDYVGIDAYFPVSEMKTPSLEDCKAGWLKYKDTLHAFSQRMGKPILFTEYGYRSVDYAGKQPWRSDYDMDQVNMEAQQNATEALLETFWDEDWFAGGFVWKWFHNHQRSGGMADARFTPQNKPTEQVLKAWYLEH